MISLSQRIQSLQGSATLLMSQKSREMKEQGIDVINLSLGEPDFDTPDLVKEAAVKAIHDNYSHYMPVPGYQDLRETISRKFSEQNGLHYTADQIVVSTGAKQSIANAVMVLVDPGDEVILPAPFWVTYSEIVRLAGGIPVIVNAEIENGFRTMADPIISAITDKTKLILFSSPCNPTGASMQRGEMEKLAAEILRKPNLYVISDEIYEHIRFEGDHQSFGTVDGMLDRTITVNGVSKAYAMTGWRVGYLGAPKEIAAACNKMQGQFTSGTCSIAQRAAKAALEAPLSMIAPMVETFRKRRDNMYERIKAIDGLGSYVPDGAFYFFPDVTSYYGKSCNGRAINNSDDLAMYLLEDAHVALVAGSAFGDDRCIRISYAASDDQLNEAMNRVSEALSNLK